MTNKTLLIAVAGLIGVSAAVAAVYDSSNFNPRDRVLQSAPEGHVPGKDNSTKEDEFGTHMAGEDCGVCHAPGGKAKDHVFTLAGTLYEDKAARKPLVGGEVIIQDFSGKVISMTSNEVGNFWTYETIASFPYSVAGHHSITKLYTVQNDGTVTQGAKKTDGSGNITIEGLPDDTRTWLYKVWVKKGNQIIQSPDMKPVGGSNSGTSYMGCGMHHAPTGSRGALWLSEKGTLASYPETNLSFKKHVLPIFMSKCASCHRPGATTTRPVMKSDVDVEFTLVDNKSTQIDFSGMHDLTAYADQSVTVSSPTGPVEWAKFGTGHYAQGFTANPDESLLLSKTMTGQTNHAGGQFWNTEHPDYKAIRQWIAEGGQNN